MVDAGIKPVPTIIGVSFTCTFPRVTTAAAVMVHPKNEGRRRAQEVQWDKARGMNPGAADFLFPGRPALVIEMKRRDPTKSKWQPGQIEYLTAAQSMGATVCVTLGWESAIDALKEWVQSFSA